MRIKLNILFFLIFMSLQISCRAQPFFKQAQWIDYIEEKGDDIVSVIAISNSNSHCSNIENRHRVIMVLFKLDSLWYAEKVTLDKEKLIASGYSVISIENTEFLESQSVLIKENFQSLLSNSNEIPGSFLEMFYQDTSTVIEVPYVNAGGRGDVNGFLNSEHEIVFQIYSLVNNNCF